MHEKQNQNSAVRLPSPRRFGFRAVFKKIIFILFGIYIFIDSYNAGYHPNRVPDMLRSTAEVFATPAPLRLQPYDAFAARIELLRSLNKVFPKGMPLPEVKSALATLGFALSEHEAVFKADNFICAVTYRVIWKLDIAGEAIDNFGGGASMKCDIDL